VTSASRAGTPTTRWPAPDWARFSGARRSWPTTRRSAGAAGRTRPKPGRRPAQDRGTWYYLNLAIYIANYAKGAYEDFDGEPDLLVDAVDLTTIHKAKGLEWAAVFVPSLTTSRFPSSRTGRPRDWLVPRQLFSRSATRAPTPTNGGCSTSR
jgi:hypothetical protein